MKDQGIFKEKLEFEEVKKFLTFPKENLILAIREHSAPLLFRCIQQILFSTGVALISLVVSFFIFNNVPLSLALCLTVAMFGYGFIMREIIHWYFHLYIVTDRKIIEVRYSPLFSEFSNSVLLDQLRCTEIDAELNGFISEFLDLGNVTITFDRPTHQEEFSLHGVRSPRKIANHLSSNLHTAANNIINPEYVWYKTPLSRTGYSFSNRIPAPYGTIQN